MSDELTEKVSAAQATARNKIAEALQEYLNVIADAGEPEIVDSAVILFEARGMSDEGLFSRHTFLPIEMSDAVSSTLGMLDITSHKAAYWLRAAALGGDEDE